MGSFAIVNLNGVLALLPISRLTDLHPGHFGRASDPHPLRRGDFTFPKNAKNKTQHYDPKTQPSTAMAYIMIGDYICSMHSVELNSVNCGYERALRSLVKLSD